MPVYDGVILFDCVSQFAPFIYNVVSIIVYPIVLS